MRGEHRRPDYVLPEKLGSSPHARGARPDRQRLRHGLRLIPACAGSTGEQLGDDRDDHGSSPHARGALAVGFLDSLRKRLIPACAGSTSRATVTSECSRAHPRMRGEHLVVVASNSPLGGSSPHARGALLLPHPPTLRRGLIPACAGSTFYVIRPLGRLPAHPRMRGEHRPGVLRRGRATRLIPACAGSTNGVGTISSTAAAHPRMRGEHLLTELHDRRRGGSSPHARGALTAALGPLRLRRLIPACAGSTVL